MREIKFRALKDDVSNCNWVYGFLAYSKDMVPRISDDGGETFHTCLKGTEGQFTGYKDWKNKDIYENDIVSAPNGQIKSAIIYFSQATFWYKEWDEMYEEWHHSEMGWCEQYGSKEIGILHWSANRIALKVIGNVHEHPELMSGRHEA